MKSLASPIVIASILCVTGLFMFDPPAKAPPAKTPPAPAAPAAPATPAKPDDAPKAKVMGDAYSLAACPVSGKKLGGGGEPVSKVYDGREVRFCCANCPAGFEKDLAASMAKLDETIVKDQLPVYALETSVVSGKKLPEKPINWVYCNRLVRLADDAEKAEFQKDPAKYMAALDKAVVEQQLRDYSFKTCPVSKELLGGMGETKNMVIAGRLIVLCCSDCVKGVNKEPAKFIAIVDEARKGKGVKKTEVNAPETVTR